MKKYLRQMLALALVFLMLTASSCGKRILRRRRLPSNHVSSEENVSSEYVPGHWFEPDDCVVKGVKPGMTMDEAQKKLGKPEVSYNVEASEFLEAYLGMEYPGMTLSFDKDSDGEYRLSCIYIHEEGISLPNGIHVGNTLNEAINAFDNPQNISFKEDSKYSDEMLYIYQNSDFSNYIPGIFDPNWPDAPVQAAYCFDYRSDLSPLMYVYCDPPVWDRDKAGYSLTTYTLYIKNTPGEDRITQIDIEKRTKKLTQGD